MSAKQGSAWRESTEAAVLQLVTAKPGMTVPDIRAAGVGFSSARVRLVKANRLVQVRYGAGVASVYPAGHDLPPPPPPKGQPSNARTFTCPACKSRRHRSCTALAEAKAVLRDLSRPREVCTCPCPAPRGVSAGA